MAAAAAAAAVKTAANTPEPSALGMATTAGAESDLAEAERAAGRVAAAFRLKPRSTDDAILG